MKTKIESKPQHTPTPWNIVEREDEIAIYKAWDSKLKPGEHNGYGDCNGGLIAKIDHQGDNAPVVTKSQAQANAAFIVRAVNCHEELLEYVKQDHEHCRKNGDHPDGKEYQEGCWGCELIAKAKGK